MKTTTHSRCVISIAQAQTYNASADMWNAAFEALRIDAFHWPNEVAAEDLEGAVAGLRAFNFLGMVVSYPHKEKIMPYLDSYDEHARNIGAVNTVVRRKENNQIELAGYNTDWIGSNRALETKIALGKDVSAVIIGAGGVARAITYGLRQKGVNVTLVNRTEDRGRQAANELGVKYGGRPEDIGDLSYNILIDATSAGHGNDERALPGAGLIREGVVAMDVVASPLYTTFLQQAQSRDCRLVHGYEMLYLQAATQFEHFTDGRPAPNAVMEAAVRTSLGIS